MMNARVHNTLSRSIRIASVLIFAACSAHAQTERSGNADARIAMQIQQLTAERTALQAENGALQKELEQAKAELAKLSSTRSSSESRAKALEIAAGREQTAREETDEQLERTRAQLQELVAKFREVANTLRDVEADRASIKNALAVQEREFKICVDRNAALYNLNAEVLDRMENRGFWSSVAEREPFTKLKRVELENLIEDYKYRADELRLEEQKQAQASQAAR